MTTNEGVKSYVGDDNIELVGIARRDVTEGVVGGGVWSGTDGVGGGEAAVEA